MVNNIKHKQVKITKDKKKKAYISKKKKEYGEVSYVRHGTKSTKSRPERVALKRKLKDLWAANDKQIIGMLIEDGLLQDLGGSKCITCGTGTLSKLKHLAGHGWRYRCAGRGCQKYFKAQANHPIFTVGNGSGFTTLQDQAAVLFCGVANVGITTCHQLTGENHKMIERVYTQLDEVRKVYVEAKENTIKYGMGAAWKDVEADEVDLRKFHDSEEVDSGKPVSWEQWGGVVERGDPRTLMLVRLNPKMTVPRSPGPGAMRKVEWQAFANKHLKDRKVVLHTDGARAYRLKVPGVIHDNVVHQKKLVIIKGKKVWLKPRFVKVAVHHLPDKGGKLKVKAGTQIIDRFWSHLRRHLGSNSARVSSHALRRKVRSGQWTYWNKGTDLWVATGEMLTEVHKGDLV
jgi:hypothetical protein